MKHLKENQKYSMEKSVENWILTCKRIKLDPYLILLTKINQWIKYLNVEPETITFLEEHTDGMCLKQLKIKLTYDSQNQLLDVYPK